MTVVPRKILGPVATTGVAAALLASSVGAAGATGRASSGTGTLTYSDVSLATTLNEFQSGTLGTEEQAVNLAPFGISFYFDQRGRLRSGFYKIVPSPSSGGKTWSMGLRKGLRWSDGQPIINKDVLLAWHAEMNPASGPQCAGTCDDIKSIGLSGQLGLVFHLKTADPSFLQRDVPAFLPFGWSLLGSGQNACLARASACGAVARNIWSNPSFNYESKSFVTSGPYQVAGFSPGPPEKAAFTPNPYWRASFVGQRSVTPLAQLVYRQFPTVSALTAGAASGATDLTTGFGVQQIPPLETASVHCGGCFSLLTGGTFDPEELLMNVFNRTVDIDGGPSGIANPLVKAKVRQALALAFNPVALEANADRISTTMARMHTSANNPFVSTPSARNSYADAELTGAWDPLRSKDVTPGTSKAFSDAKELLREAGYARNLTVYVTTDGTDNPARSREVAFLASKEAWGRIGVTVKYVDVSRDQLFADWSHDGLGPHGHYEALILAYTGNPPLPDGWYPLIGSGFCPQTASAAAAEQDQNWSCIRDPRIDRAFAALLKTADVKARRADADLVSREFNRQAYWSILGTSITVGTADPHVGGAASNEAPPVWYPWRLFYR